MLWVGGAYGLGVWLQPEGAGPEPLPAMCQVTKVCKFPW